MPERVPTDRALKGLKASRSSAGQSTRFRGERSQDRSLPRRPIGALTGDGAGPVLKTVSTATCGDPDLSAPPFHGRLTGQGPGAGWKPRGTLEAYGHRALSLPPLRKVNPAGAGRPFEAGWMGNHWGSRPRPSASSRTTANVAAHTVAGRRPTPIDAEWSTGSSLGSYPRGRPFNSVLRNHHGQVCKRPKQRRRKRRPFGVRRFESVPCPPRGHSSMAEFLPARQKTSDRNRDRARAAHKGADDPCKIVARGAVPRGPPFPDRPMAGHPAVNRSIQVR